MKLIIDIPEITYNATLERGQLAICNDNDIYQWLKNGTPIPDNATVCDIEQIRNEVQRMADSKILNMKIVLELIDKYTKGDKE